MEDFFEKQENEILSIEYQKGLFGELIFLKEYLFCKYSFAESIFFWTGCDRTTHDFQIYDNAIEIKTTSSKQHKKFSVSSEKQLDNIGLEHLYLSVISLNLHHNLPERTLPSLIKEILVHIQGDSIATFQLQLKLAKYGYNENLAEKYITGFSLNEIRFFEVKDGFPRILYTNLLDGVGDLNYSVVVAACTPFEITRNFIDYI